MKKRILQFLIRWGHITDKPLPRWLERACDKDITLSLELEDEIALTKALRTEEKVDGIDPNPYLADRIIRSLDEAKPRSTFPFLFNWKEISIGLAACVAAALAILLVIETPQSEETVVVAEFNEIAPIEEMGDALLLNAGEWKNPLDQEIENVVKDARGAIDFLAYNFLPSNVLKRENKS